MSLLQLKSTRESPDEAAGEGLTAGSADDALLADTLPDQLPDAATAEFNSALAPELTDAVAGDASLDDGMGSERDAASNDELHDVALAAEKSRYSPQGHEVTSPPSDDDQGESIRIVTEAVADAGSEHPGATQPSPMPEPAPPHRVSGGSAPAEPSNLGPDQTDENDA